MSLEMLDVRASVLMELIVDKLSLLDYENKFCNSRKPPWPRLHKFYFALPCSTRNEQFIYFVSLVSWLSSLIGRKFMAPKEQSDLNATCTDLMQHLKELGFILPNWAASKLKQGFGDAVCSVLDSLTDLALEAQKFQFNPPIHSQKGSIDEDVEVITVHGVNKKEVCVFTDAKLKASDEKSLTSPDISSRNLHKQNTVRDYYMEAKVEAERAACQSRANMGSDGKDWRLHLNEAQQLHCDMSDSLSACCTQLEKVEEDISFCLDKLETREKFLNKQFEPLLADYTQVKGRLMDVQQRHEQSMKNVTNFNNQLASTLDQLDKVKHNLMEKGNKISDMSPLVEIKKSVVNLKVELQEMEVRVGVLEHTLMQNQLNHSISMTNMKCSSEAAE